MFFTTILENLCDLVLIDAQRSAVMLKERLKTNSELRRVLDDLETDTDRKALFELLNALIYDQGDGDGDRLLLNATANATNDFELLRDTSIHEKLLQLMCTYRPELVTDFLRDTDRYRIDVALQV